ncbi:uncharacterized protein HMPREF1541_10325 [Cyphellophora europaea CBS 101466]|uniref:Uncharacterized protein n=1 Tax=Cyphellophora europaea (strain CBS 101466) TaxID=1220924 RepID=W2S7P6_CYPE1|nr:uncharacterized protein HMPREF1541_10325 [Cyphellophora europaea CBS 101466]ETN44655.1 hypothetical protein HMPREF1541_10325 [Cyphellophora europaea CBS 101466]
MFDAHKPDRLLAQVPLTVSPFLSMPTAVSLPYSFRQVPTSLPPSVIDDPNSDKPKYITSSSGHTAHPDDIIASCNALQQHITKSQQDARKVIEEWEQSIKVKELAEKRRVAPGWLDRDEKILEPTKAGSNAQKQGLLDEDSADVKAPAMSPSREGEELDRAFGTLAMK